MLSRDAIHSMTWCMYANGPFCTGNNILMVRGEEANYTMPYGLKQADLISREQVIFRVQIVKDFDVPKVLQMYKEDMLEISRPCWGGGINKQLLYWEIGRKNLNKRGLKSNETEICQSLPKDIDL